MTPLERWKEIQTMYAAGYSRGLTEGGLWGMGHDQAERQAFDRYKPEARVVPEQRRLDL